MRVCVCVPWCVHFSHTEIYTSSRDLQRVNLSFGVVFLFYILCKRTQLHTDRHGPRLFFPVLLNIFSCGDRRFFWKVRVCVRRPRKAPVVFNERKEASPSLTLHTATVRCVCMRAPNSTNTKRIKGLKGFR